MKLENRVFYKAIVYSEPTVLGGIRVRVPEIHGIPNSTAKWIPDEQLPYAYPATQYRSSDWGQNMIPLLGTQVYVAFYDDSNLIYFGNALPSTNYVQQTQVREVFMGQPLSLGKPYTIVNKPYQTTIFKSLKGSTIEISDQDLDEYIKITGPQGGHITIGNRSLSRRRRGDNDITKVFKVDSSNNEIEIPLDTYIDIDDGKGNNLIWSKDGTITMSCKHFQLNADTTNIYKDFCNGSTSIDEK